MGAFSLPKKVPQLRPILVTFSKMWPILVSFFEFVSDFGLAPETFFGHGFGQKIQFFSKLRQFFFEIHGFLLRGWLGRLAELAELAGWAEKRKRKEDEKEEGGGGRGEEGGRRRRREEGAGIPCTRLLWDSFLSMGTENASGHQVGFNSEACSCPVLV